MLWLFVIVMVGGLLFVMFHKPAVHPNVGGWAPPLAPPAPKPVSPDALRSAETQPSMSAIAVGELDQLLAETAAAGGADVPDPEDDVATAAFVPMDFNDIFGSKAPSTDGPRAPRA